MLNFIKEHRDRVALVGLGVGLVVFIGVGVYMQKNNQKPPVEKPVEEIKKVELRVAATGSGQGTGQKEGSPAPAKSNAFYLKPSPTELIDQLSELEDLREDAVEKRFMTLKVLWPLYFFSYEQLEGEKARVLFDVDQDGFGLEVASQVDLLHFPELTSLESGTRVWVGGEIIGIDFSGTGMIHLTTEHLDLSEEGPAKRLMEQQNEAALATPVAKKAN